MDIKQIIKYSKGSCTASEREAVEKHMATSKETVQLVEKYRQLYSLKDEIEGIEAFDEQVALDKIRAHTIGKAKAKRSLIQRFVRIAAMLLFPLMIASVTAYLFFSDKSDWIEIHADKDEVLKHIMPDNSIVLLQRGSALRYTNNYISDRRVELMNGEAFFEVEANKGHPFYVDTQSGVTVYVYGTQFNLRNYSTDSILTTVLKKGKLNIITPDSTIMVDTGQVLKFNKYTLVAEKKDADIEKEVAWIDNTLIFRDASISQMLAELAVYYNIEVVSTDHNNTDYRFRATFKNENIENVLNYISQSASIKWEIIRGSEKQVRDKLVIDIY